MITLDEAIKHAEEVANDPEQCFQCTEEHRKLAEWLKELKELREQKRPHGEWKCNRDVLELICSVCGEALPFSDEYDYETNFCPNCGADMREGDAKEKEPCPCDTCQTAIDRCGCQMHLCSDYQKWREGDADD